MAETAGRFAPPNPQKEKTMLQVKKLLALSLGLALAAQVGAAPKDGVYREKVMGLIDARCPERRAARDGSGSTGKS